MWNRVESGASEIAARLPKGISLHQSSEIVIKSKRNTGKSNYTIFATSEWNIVMNKECADSILITTRDLRHDPLNPYYGEGY